MSDWTRFVPQFTEKNHRELIDFVSRQRWFGQKESEVMSIELADFAELSTVDPLFVCLVDVHLGSGSSEVYQLFVNKTPASISEPGEANNFGEFITEGDGFTLRDGVLNRALTRLIIEASEEEHRVSARLGEFGFRAIRSIDPRGNVRPLNADQSNTSIVFDERILIKLYRRLQAGMNPELEMLLFLTEHGFEHVPQLAGWYSYTGESFQGTLGVAQVFLSEAQDGWKLALDQVRTSPEQLIDRFSRLGTVIGEMHCVLASDETDPDFAPESPTTEASAILGARLEDHIDRLSNTLTGGRRQALQELARMLTDSSPSGRLIRTHGDLHLGQVLWSHNDWIVTDFEGEPARSHVERRQKANPLRDVAGILRSFSYLVAAASAESKGQVSKTFFPRAKSAFLDAYRARVAEISLLPLDLEAQDRAIQVFELEKMLYELDYELNHRPDWTAVPLSGIDDLLTETR